MHRLQIYKIYYVVDVGCRARFFLHIISINHRVPLVVPFQVVKTFCSETNTASNYLLVCTAHTHTYDYTHIRSILNVIYYYYISSTTEYKVYKNNNMDAALTINGGQCLRDENAAGRGVSVWIFAQITIFFLQFKRALLLQVRYIIFRRGQMGETKKKSF